MSTLCPSNEQWRPLLAPWYRIVPDGDRLLLEHAESVIAFDGAAVRAFLPALLPLLDGTRGIDAIVEELGEPVREAVGHALDLLTRSGLLVDGPPADPSAQALAAVLGLSPNVVRSRLQAASVAVVGSGGEQVARIFHTSGVGGVAPFDGSRDVGLVVAVAEHGGQVALNGIIEFCVSHDVALLPVQPFNGRHALVGPLVLPGKSACLECVRLRRATNLPYESDFALIDSVSPAVTSDPGLQATVIGLAAHLGLRWLAARDALLPGVLFALAVSPRVTVSEHNVIRVPRCPVCSDAHRTASPLPWHAAEAV